MDMKVRMLFRFIVLAAIFLSRERFAAAQEIEADQSAAKATFIHPGGWHTVADIKRVRTQLAANAQPWAHARDILLGSGPKQDYKPEAVATVTRGTGGVEQGGNAALQHEASDAYTLMIKWIATDDPAYADAAIRIIDAWSEKLMAIRGSDARLAAGIYGNKFAQAAELAAYYNPHWPNKARAQKMFLTVFYPVIEHGASENWGTSCMAGSISIGIFCDRRDLFDKAIEAYQHGYKETFPRDGRAAVTQYIDESGEVAESGRDQPHTQGGIAHLLETAVVAWNQGINLFPYGNDRLLAGFEYTAKYNLGNDVPYHAFIRANGQNPYPNGISAKGRAQFSPVYEMAYAYFTAAGMDCPWTKQVRDPHRARIQLEKADYSPEVTNNDHPGLGQLMFTTVPGQTISPQPPVTVKE
jgi:hypothetical protein